MSIQKEAWRLYCRLGCALTQRQAIFIVSHMRSGSSLLVHLLCNNPEIAGFGETHIRYPSARLDKLAYRIMTTVGGGFPQGRYLLDKVLHRDGISSEMLQSKQARFIFLLRDPRQTLPSILKLKSFDPRAFIQTSERAGAYYRRRLRIMVQYATTIANRHRMLFLSHASLLYATNQVFDALGDFLDLKSPLTEHYQLLPNSGKPGVGDPSPMIRRGYIVRSARNDTTALPSRVAQETFVAHEQTRQLLESVCRTPEPTDAWERPESFKKAA